MIVHNQPSGGNGRASARPDRSTPDHPCLAAALDLLDKGLWPVAIHPPGSDHASAGKAPIGDGWGVEKPDADSLRAKWARYPDASVGLLLGPRGGVVDLEIDDPETGEDSLLAMLGGEVIETAGWTSHRGGHLLFEWDDRLSEFDKAKYSDLPGYPGLEIRLGGGPKQSQSVCPPSPTTTKDDDGKTIALAPRQWNGVGTIARLPAAFYSNMRAAIAAKAPQWQQERPTPPPRRDDASAVDRYVQAAVVREAENVEGAGEGKRNDTLNVAGFNLGQLVGAGVLARSTAEDALMVAARNAGLSHAESIATIASGINSGIAKPRDMSTVGKPRLRVVSPAREVPPTDTPGATTADGEDIRPNEADNDPHRLARVYLARNHEHPDGRTLRYWRDEYWGWDGVAYRTILPGEMRANLAGSIKSEFDRINVDALRVYDGQGKPPVAGKVTTSLVANTMQALGGYVTLPSTAEQPTWLDGTDWAAADVLAARNGLIHLPSYVSGRSCHRSPTPAFFSGFALDFDFNHEAPEPVEWFKFLRSVWPSDQESIDCLQEWLGLLLVPDTSHQKILAMVGPKRSGKSTIGRLIQMLVGARNCAGPTLSSLTGPFGLEPLVGKSVATVSDARLSGRSDATIIVERLLSISGEDPLTVDRKHKTAWYGKLPTRVVILTNELPKLVDSSGALAGRLVILRFIHSFYGKEDRQLMGRLTAELPSILLWAIGGWKRLQERGHLVQPASGQELVSQMEEFSSPVGSFVRDCCVVDPAKAATVADVFASWKTWCEANNRKDIGDAATLGRNLRAVIPHLTTPQRRMHGEVKRVYQGLGLLSDDRETPGY